MYYWYSHSRLDTNEIFYIWIWSNTWKHPKYRRAKSCSRRSNLWNNIYNKHWRTVSIDIESDNLESIKQRECNQIKHFWRIDNWTGILANHTDWWDGRFNCMVSEETRAKMRQRMLLYRHTPESRSKISAALKGRKHSQERINNNSIAHIWIKHSLETRIKLSIAHRWLKQSSDWVSKRTWYNRTPVDQYTLDWVFIKTYPYIKEAARITWTNQSWISQCLTWKYSKSWNFIRKYHETWNTK